MPVEYKFYNRKFTKIIYLKWWKKKIFKNNIVVVVVYKVKWKLFSDFVSTRMEINCFSQQNKSENHFVEQEEKVFSFS